jgi:hypothetical protein
LARRVRAGGAVTNKPKCETCGDTGEVGVHAGPLVHVSVSPGQLKLFCDCEADRQKRREDVGGSDDYRR